jgi:hypothetical protein
MSSFLADSFASSAGVMAQDGADARAISLWRCGSCHRNSVFLKPSTKFRLKKISVQLLPTVTHEHGEAGTRTDAHWSGECDTIWAANLTNTNAEQLCSCTRISRTTDNTELEFGVVHFAMLYPRLKSTLGWLTADKFERILKGAVVTYWIKPRNISVRIAGVTVGITTRHL